MIGFSCYEKKYENRFAYLEKKAWWIMLKQLDMYYSAAVKCNSGTFIENNVTTLESFLGSL